MQVARDLLNHHPVCVLVSGTVGEAAKLLAALDVRFLPVIDHRQRLVGTFTDQELWRACEKMGSGDPKQAFEIPVEAAMNRELLALDPDADLAEVIDLMIDHSVFVVPVIDHAAHLTGTISYADVLRYLALSYPPGTM